MTTHFPKLVILAGGMNSRFWPLREKSLLKFMDKPLLEHQLETYLNLGFNDVVVVCNPANQNQISEILAKFSARAKTQTSVQVEPKGMGDALLTLEPALDLASDPVAAYIVQVHDVFDESFHAALVEAYRSNPEAACLAAYEVTEYFPGGYLVVDDDLTIKNIIEKPRPGEEPSNLVNIVAHIHPDLRRLLDYIKQEYSSDNPSDDHYERAMAKLMASTPFRAVPYKGRWCPIKYSWHVLDAMNYYLSQLSTLESYVADDAQVEEGAYISKTGPVYIGQGVKIERGAYITGPVYIGDRVRIFHGADIRGPVYIGANSIIGQSSVVRESMISQGSIIGLESEVNRSYIGRGANLHNAMILDSVIAESEAGGTHTNLSARMVTANFRGDAGRVKSTIRGQRIDTGRTKLGAIIGAGSFIGIGAMLMPGIKIGEHCMVGAATLVNEDIPDNTRYYVEQSYIKKALSD